LLAMRHHRTLTDWVKLAQAHQYAALENPSASLARFNAGLSNWCGRWPRKV
jgi:hypothetical protein